MAIEILDLPIENGGSFHSYVNVYQRVKFPFTNPLTWTDFHERKTMFPKETNPIKITECSNS